ncbi:MAG: hypothetical protein JO032_16615 [Alphaproteobacteria bacterium]|nr:hypothetical protein [Alphaproteobacteria bacterium]MBV9554405.1 hypothetical protein [Alphaproteobacteria bacterium]
MPVDKNPNPAAIAPIYPARGRTSGDRYVLTGSGVAARHAHRPKKTAHAAVAPAAD